MNNQLCECLNAPMFYDKYIKIKEIGLDETNGRYGEVELWQCRICGRYWLHYLVEYESYTGSGRYFMGLITKKKADVLSPNEAVDYLNHLDWHLYGGSYFDGKSGKSTGKLRAEL